MYTHGPAFPAGYLPIWLECRWRARCILRDADHADRAFDCDRRAELPGILLERGQDAARVFGVRKMGNAAPRPIIGVAEVERIEPHHARLPVVIFGGGDDAIIPALRIAAGPDRAFGRPGRRGVAGRIGPDLKRALLQTANLAV